MQTEAANLMVEHAARVYEGGSRAGAEANMAKYLASEAFGKPRYVHADAWRICVRGRVRC